ncbi:hypothetical protein [Texcoconibacillus texcoconensis]|uniref:DUF3784 domain-containing protein n=1 Tax=Texcoconibacillus texcoconensis TaxID=1095777 RepID=A0A840QKE1_9BACI|nr:hypothetical protein [Texcoconibacillus texcoconensis]MBB5171946.1 hypothetical protein [Texcoconibacillus texcoconensis]
MKYLMNYGFLLFTIVLTFLGYLKLINSVENGRNLANEYLRKSMGGSMDSDNFRIITEGYILSNVTLGGVMFFVGLSSFCFCIYKIFKEFS